MGRYNEYQLRIRRTFGYRYRIFIYLPSPIFGVNIISSFSFKSVDFEMTQSIFFWFLHSRPEQCNLIFRLLVANENHGDVKLDYSCCWFMLCLDETRLERIRLLWCVDLKDVLAPQFLPNNLSEKIQTEKRPILNSKNDFKYLQIFPFLLLDTKFAK